MKKPIAKRENILKFIKDFIDRNEYPPTVRDIQGGCQISSTSVVDYNLKALEREGLIRRHRDISRGIEILGEGRDKGKTMLVPLIGNIAAGEPIPIPGEDTWTSPEWETVPIPREMVRGKDDIYALRVKGTSMIDAFIDDGDIVLMQPTDTAEDGELVAAWLKLENETTLKKFYKDRECIRLQPANPNMKPIYVKPGNLAVQGKVVGVIRQIS